MVLHGVMLDAPLLARTDDGVDLALYRARPASPRPGAPPLLLVHGTFSNRRFFLGAGDRGLARWLADRGFDAWVAELRGHGRSGAVGRASAWHFEDWIRRDAPALVRAVLGASGADRVVWVGHSAGGVIAAAFAGLGHPESERIAGIVMAGAPAPNRPGAWHVPLAALGYGVTRVFGRFPARLLRVGPEDEHRGIMGQWMEWNVRGRWIGTDGTDYLAAAARVTAPVLAVAGAGDFIAPPSACRLLLESLGAGDRTLLVCGRRSGFSENFTHNRTIVSTAARREIWPRIAGWIEQRFG
ncbi:MAG: alpha/beta fold hydrolase [Gemmatimonadales bacterium]